MDKFKRILLAEDDVNDVELCLKALTDGKFVNFVDVVRDGVEAMDYLCCKGAFKERTTGNPSFIMLDIKMPRKSGLEVLREVRSNEGLKLIPVVILTSSKQEQDISISYNLGVNAYVVKPVDLSKFIAVVREIGVFWAVVNQSPLEGEL